MESPQKRAAGTGDRLIGFDAGCRSRRHDSSRFGRAVRRIVKEQFRGQGVGPTGPWQPLSAAYRRWKEARFPGAPILVRSGATLRALTSNTEHSIVIPTATELTFGVALPYPIFHQRGGKRLPRRPIFDLTEQHKIRLVKVVQVRLLSAGRDNGVTLQ